MMIDGIMVEAQTLARPDRSLVSLLRDPLETGFLGRESACENRAKRKRG
jgi:hypothetical protein